MKLQKIDVKPIDIISALLIFALLSGVIAFGFYVRQNRILKKELVEFEQELVLLNKALANLQKTGKDALELPPLSRYSWGKDITEGLSQVAREAGVKIARILYVDQPTPNRKNVGTVSFEIEMRGDKSALIDCLALIRKYVTGMKVNSIDITGSNYERSNESREVTYAMKISGSIYYYLERSKTKPETS